MVGAGECTRRLMIRCLGPGVEMGMSLGSMGRCRRGRGLTLSGLEWVRGGREGLGGALEGEWEVGSVVGWAEGMAAGWVGLGVGASFSHRMFLWRKIVVTAQTLARLRVNRYILCHSKGYLNHRSRATCHAAF